LEPGKKRGEGVYDTGWRRNLGIERAAKKREGVSWASTRGGFLGGNQAKGPDITMGGAYVIVVEKNRLVGGGRDGWEKLVGKTHVLLWSKKRVTSASSRDRQT